MNVYYDPDQHGLETFGEIDWSDGNYCFDLTVVWRRTSDGTFVYCEDLGCSCPTPFEDTPVEKLTAISSLAQFKEILDGRNANCYDGDRSAQMTNLIERMHGAGAR